MDLDIYGKTDIGKEREKNEDTFIIANDSNMFDIDNLGILLAIADGVGGHPLGDVASAMACEGILKYYSKELKDKSSSFLLNHLVNEVYNIHIMIKKYNEQHLLRPNMGTTLSCLVLRKTKALIVNVGDSRVYRMRKGELVKLTKDHTMAQQLVDLGQIDEDDSYSNPLCHMLTQALGMELVSPYVKEEDVLEKDTYLICSDGLYNMISFDEIASVLKKDTTSKEKCENLISLALDKGGKDNITVIVAQVLK